MYRSGEEGTVGRTRLCWGCCDQKIDGWITGAPDAKPNQEISCNIVLDGLPLDSNSVDMVVSAHVLQYLRADEVLSALREFRRVLKPGNRRHA